MWTSTGAAKSAVVWILLSLPPRDTGDYTTGYRCPVPGTLSVSHDVLSRSGAPSTGRSLRILLVIQEATVLRFPLLIPALAERGHRVHIAFASGRGWQTGAGEQFEPPTRALRLVEELAEEFPQV